MSKVITILFCTVLIISACGGSDNQGINDAGTNDPGANDPGTNDPSNGNPGVTDKINPELPGKLFFVTGTAGSIVAEGDAYSAWTMDISTGQYSKIPNTNWSAHTDRFPANGVSFTATALSYDGAELVVTGRYCMDDPDRSCIAFQDNNGNYVGQFDVFGKITGLAKMSWDKQYVAFFRSSLSVDQGLEIYDRNGNLISRSELNNTYFDWLPDGRIAYAFGRDILFTQANSAVAEQSLTLPNNIVGDDIKHIAVSPDGTQLAFAVGGFPYLVNLDGSDLRKLASVTYRDTVTYNMAWSPDGQWILISEGGGQSAIEPTPSGVPAPIRLHYIIPTQNTGKVFDLSFVEGDRSPEVRVLQRYEDVEENPNSSITETAFTQSVSWLP